MSDWIDIAGDAATKLRENMVADLIENAKRLKRLAPVYPTVWRCCGREFSQRRKQCSGCGGGQTQMTNKPPTADWFDESIRLGAEGRERQRQQGPS